MISFVAAMALAQGGAPQIVHFGLAAPDVIEVRIREGEAVYARKTPFEPLPTDTVSTGLQPWVERDGKSLGALLPAEPGWLYPVDGFFPPTLQPAAFQGARVAGHQVLAIYRKTRPTDFARTGPWKLDAPLEHTLYLLLRKPVSKSEYLTVQVAGLRAKARVEQMVCDSIHLNQNGYGLGDTAKLATFGAWMGDGGGLDYVPKRFAVKDAEGEVVLEGPVKLRKRADANDEDSYQANYAKSDVYEMDLSELGTPGEYTVVVDELLRSRPFGLREHAWESLFKTSMEGFVWQRNGQALPRRPRGFHPDDGVKVYASTCSLMDSGNGLNARGTDKDNFGNLVKGATDEEVPNAWGGYFDAGDWDRRIQHLEATRLQLELLELKPVVGLMRLAIPDNKAGMVDLLEEAMWSIDVYRRMQLPDGGVRGGIESEEHPLVGETSWTTGLRNYAYAPDPWSSALYAATAAKLAFSLRSRHPELAAEYERTALLAAHYAENWQPEPDRPPLPHQVRDARNLAAAELYRLTGDAKWHELFKATSAFSQPREIVKVWQEYNQGEAAFTYVRTAQALDPDLKRNCEQAILKSASAAVGLGARSSYGVAKEDPFMPFGFGVVPLKDAISLVRGHALSGDARLLRTLYVAAGVALGANPINMTMVTDVGWNAPKRPLICDPRYAGSPWHPGIPVYGPQDPVRNWDATFWPLIDANTYPGVKEWPAMECYFDIFWFPSMTEYTIMETMGPASYAWGYLASFE